MNLHTDLINYIAKKIGAKSYLEIGVFNPDHNFNKVEIENKIGVDPDPNAKASLCISSDEYFKTFLKFPIKFDVVFIDGLHYKDQVRKDAENAWFMLNDGGVIIFHDCNPPTKQTTCIPRGAQREWCGDVYKTICKIISYKFTVDFDYGCTVLHKNGEDLEFTEQDIEWEEFDAFRKEALNLVSIEEAKKIIDSWM